MLDIQEKKKKLIQAAFSGMKSKETQRQKKEARLQGEFVEDAVAQHSNKFHTEIVELFGLREGGHASQDRSDHVQHTLDEFAS